MSLQRRVERLEARSPARAPGRLFVLIPDLWPEADRTVFSIAGGEDLVDLVERRTGVRPVLGTGRIWAIIHHLPEDVRGWDDTTKAAFLDAHETRPLALWQRREQV